MKRDMDDVSDGVISGSTDVAVITDAIASDRMKKMNGREVIIKRRRRRRRKRRRRRREEKRRKRLTCLGMSADRVCREEWDHHIDK
eukprot:762804-Hanusia_phi.AAC.1